MNKTTIIKNAFFSFLKSFVTLLSPIITFPYASRILMPEGIGKINFANSVILYFIILAEFEWFTFVAWIELKGSVSTVEIADSLTTTFPIQIFSNSTLRQR